MNDLHLRAHVLMSDWKECEAKRKLRGQQSRATSSVNFSSTLSMHVNSISRSNLTTSIVSVVAPYIDGTSLVDIILQGHYDNGTQYRRSLTRADIIPVSLGTRTTWVYSVDHMQVEL
jgi:hypothetical protein